jgi:F-box domain
MSIRLLSTNRFSALSQQDDSIEDSSTSEQETSGLGFQSATPVLVFEKIFSHLSPGYLWMVCRNVCKSWRSFVDAIIVDSLENRALVQFWRHKQEYDHDDMERREYDVQATYRCTKSHLETDGSTNAPRRLMIFTPFEGRAPYSISYKSCQYTPFWIHKISTSVFSGAIPRKKVDMYGDPKQLTGKVLWYHKPVIESRSHDFLGPLEKNPWVGNNVTQEALDEFNHRPMTKSAKPTQVSLGRDKYSRYGLFCNLFDVPSVDTEIICGAFKFKCRYLTKLSMEGIAKAKYVAETMGWGNTRLDYKTFADYDLVIDEIEVPMDELLKWRCGCDKAACTIDKLIYWTCPSLYPRKSRYYKAPFTHWSEPTVKAVATRSRWEMHKPLSKKKRIATQNRCNNLTKSYESSASSFTPWKMDLEERRTRGKKTEIPPNCPCTGTRIKIQTKTGTKEIKRVAMAAESCIEGMCGRCCKKKDCTAHGRCYNCRRNGTAKQTKRNEAVLSCSCLFYGVHCDRRKLMEKASWKTQKP